MKISLKYDKSKPDLYLGIAITALQGALDASVTKLAEANGVADLTWFDELHQQAVISAKGAVTEQIPIEGEADAIRFGFELVDALFQTIRVGLVEKQQ